MGRGGGGGGRERVDQQVDAVECVCVYLYLCICAFLSVHRITPPTHPTPHYTTQHLIGEEKPEAEVAPLVAYLREVRAKRSKERAALSYSKALLRDRDGGGKRVGGFLFMAWCGGGCVRVFVVICTYVCGLNERPDSPPSLFAPPCLVVFA